MAGPRSSVLDRLEGEGDPEAITEYQELKLALSERHTTVTSEQIVGEGAEATMNRSGVQVTHQRGARVRLYKPRGGMRLVQAGEAGNNMDRLLDPGDGGWSLRCPKCNTDCGGAPWGCGKDPEPKYYQCPVAACNADNGGHGPKKFYDKPMEMTANRDPNRIDDPLFQTAQVSSGQANLYAHLWAFHPDVAAANRVPR